MSTIFKKNWADKSIIYVNIFFSFHAISWTLNYVVKDFDNLFQQLKSFLQLFLSI